MDFRLYDNVLGRFFGMDALSENYHYISTYHFSYNNPIMFADPTGLMPSIIQAAWDATPEGTNSIWVNVGNGFQGSNGIFLTLEGGNGGGGLPNFENYNNQYNKWVVSEFKHKFVPTNRAKTKGIDVITYKEYLYNDKGLLMMTSSYIEIKNGKIIYKRTHVSIKNEDGNFVNLNTNNHAHGLETYSKAVLNWIAFDEGSSPLQMKATENREWNATEGKRIDYQRNFAKDKLSDAASSIPYIGKLVSEMINDIDVSSKKPEHADLIIEIRRKLKPLN